MGKKDMMAIHILIHYMIVFNGTTLEEVTAEYKDSKGSSDLANMEKQRVTFLLLFLYVNCVGY